MDYTPLLEQLLASNEAVLNRLEILVILSVIQTSLFIFMILRRKRNV